MASLRDIRKRIRSVKNTQQITKAMKMVAAAKLRKAQDAITAARPYAVALDQMIAEVASRAEGGEGTPSHPLLTSRPVRRVDVVVLSSDRGLAGGFNSNIIRRVNRFLFENKGTYESIRLVTIGRKVNDFFRKREVEILRDYPGLYSRVNFQTAQEIAETETKRFLDGECDAVFVVYNEFLSAISQRVVVNQVLPVQSAPSEAGTAAAAPAGSATGAEFEFEPGRTEVLERLLPQAIAIKLYRALLESVASEHGARMSAMDNATSNASDMIGRLTLFYNRTRQAAITKELMEIVSGAEALK